MRHRVGKAAAPDSERRSEVNEFLALVAKLLVAEKMRERLAEGAPSLDAAIQRTAESLIEEWIEKRYEQTVQEGIQVGKRELIQRMLTRKFGPLPATVIASLDAATSEELKQVADHLVGAEALGAIFDI